MSNINPEEFEDFHIPRTFLDQLIEFTGADDSSRGFILACVDQHGQPMVLSRFNTQITEMGLRKALEKYLIQAEESEDGPLGPPTGLGGFSDFDDDLN
tara:strand:+ start:5183 stop:5476 length:294 start_codon:yes stop_codon:yes gene_type:complete